MVDTNVVSELRKLADGKADRNVVAWTRSVHPSALFLSAVCLMELERGKLRMERRDRVQGALLRKWLDKFVVPGFEGRILPFDDRAACRCAAFHVPDPKAERDAMIAATAVVHGLTVVTRNTADFVSTGVQVLNPWLP